MRLNRFLPSIQAAGQTLITLAILGAPVAVANATWMDEYQKHCRYEAGGGVLVSGHVYTFPCYLELLLKQNIPYVLLAAVILVVVSGIQYMLAQGNSSEQAKAKQRIVGIIGGIIFYFLIQYLIPLISGGIHL